MTSHLNLGDANTELRRSRIATALSAHWDELAAPTKRENFSIMRMLDSMMNQKFNRKDSYEGALCDAAARANMSEFDPQRAIVPWGVFADRNLTVGVPSAGGNLVGAQVGDVLDVLRPYSVLANMGVRTVDPGAENLMVPNVTTATTGQWLAHEASELSQSNPVIGVISSAPKTAGALLKASFLFMRQARQGEAFIRRQLLGAMAETLDRAILQGTGSEGQPVGLKYAAGVEELTLIPPATFFDHDDALAMEARASTAGAYDLKWMASPTMRVFLRQQQGAHYDNGGLWRDGKMLDYPAFVTTHCPTLDIYLGDWSLCSVAFWGGGLQIEVDPYTSFKNGAVQVRVLMNCDVYFEKPGSFVRWVE
jgi:HK97 family phage major capsid protein